MILKKNILIDLLLVAGVSLSSTSDFFAHLHCLMCGCRKAVHVARLSDTVMNISSVRYGGYYSQIFRKRIVDRFIGAYVISSITDFKLSLLRTLYSIISAFLLDR